jgi:processive 1,2-diacylglycerol beta-glucosyltransferase
MLREYDPEVVICTHFLPAEIISYLSAKERIGCRQAIVVTDFDVHAMWLCHHFERYFVAIEESREHLVRLGIPPEKVTVSGIPIDPIFMQPKEKEEMRAKLGLDSGLPTILISAGGFGVGPIEAIMESLAGLKHPAQIIAICGRNEELKERIEKVAARLPEGAHPSMKVIGYTTVMDEYMASSDILLGKPGGLTTSEALAKGLAFAIVDPIPGQEERNADHLLEEGVAIRCNNLLVLPYKLDRLLDDPLRLASMRERALKLARPDAAYRVVDTLVAAEGEWKNGTNC